MKRILLILLTGAMTALSAGAEPWTVDQVHSQVGFVVRHMMVSNVRGEFTNYDATVDFDPAKPEAMTIRATVDVNSVSTRNDKRDTHLKSADFFDAANHPTMTFVSKKVTKVDDGHFKVTGDLTIRGTTKEITLDVTGLNAIWNDSWGYRRTGASATAVINRRDFGLNWSAAMEAGGVVASDEVTISLEIELQQKRS